MIDPPYRCRCPRQRAYQWSVERTGNEDDAGTNHKLHSAPKMAVIDLQDEGLILPVLEQDRLWAAYALCDLDEPYRHHSRFLGFSSESPRDAVLLVHGLPNLSVLVPCWSPDSVCRIIEQARDLPVSALVMARSGDRPAIERRYRFDAPTPMLRMVVSAATLTVADLHAAARLDIGDEEAIRELYALWPETTFRRRMLEAGIMYGIHAEGRLVAVAGTHAISTRHRIAAIGGVFTHPRYRSRGLATVATGAVAATLRANGVHDIVLNVRADNGPAIAAYHRLGFTGYVTFAEATAVRR